MKKVAKKTPKKSAPTSGHRFLGKYVVVTDTHRGVVAGVLTARSTDGNEAELDDARHCFNWKRNASEADQGIFGLATAGPERGSLVGPAVAATVRDVSKILLCSAAAESKWRAAKWG